MLTRADLQAIGQHLGAVTAQTYKLEVRACTPQATLCQWQNITRVGYVLALDALDYRTFHLCLGRVRGTGTAAPEVETLCDVVLDKAAMARLVGEPRRLVRILLGQERAPQP